MKDIAKNTLRLLSKLLQLFNAENVKELSNFGKFTFAWVIVGYIYSLCFKIR